MTIPFTHDDGGRADAGYRGETGDCGARALAIAVPHLDYRTAYDLVNEYAEGERPRKRKRSNARTGLHTSTMKRILADLGWVWTPTMFVGQGCRVHLTAEELPATGRHILNLSKHFAALVDGTVRDTHLDDRGGTRCVYGYWSEEEPA